MKPLQPLLQFTLLITVISLVLSTETTRADGTVARIDPYAARKLFYEAHWQHKIESALEYVDGVIVNVDVELTPEIERSVNTKKYDPKTVAEWETVQTSRTEGHDSDQPPRSAAPASRSDTAEKETSEVRYLVSESQSTTTTAGLIPASVSVSVSVPKSYFVTVWTNRQRTTSSAESKREISASDLNTVQREVCRKIELAVKVLLPRKESDWKRVCVTSFDDVAGRRQTSASRIQDELDPLLVADRADRDQ